MGGRGARSGGRYLKDGTYLPYGSEYTTVLKSGNIKFVKINNGTPTAPMETMTKGRVYVTIGTDGNPKYITYFDTENKRTKQIDLDQPHYGVSPHTHHGYFHKENDSAKGYANLTTEEKKMVERVRKIWYNRHSK
ncbi:MAG: hypothetical protein LUC89_08850 [Oscillospiraceae bacterium]|nr:hypothetical protein [Oscillospiraceae bacterium]